MKELTVKYWKPIIAWEIEQAGNPLVREYAELVELMTPKSPIMAKAIKTAWDDIMAERVANAIVELGLDKDDQEDSTIN